MAFTICDCTVHFDQWKAKTSEGKVYCEMPFPSQDECKVLMKQASLIEYTASKALPFDEEAPSGWEPLAFIHIVEENNICNVVARQIKHKFVGTQLFVDVSCTVKSCQQVERHDLYRIPSSPPGRLSLRIQVGLNPTVDVVKEKKELNDTINIIIQELKAVKNNNAKLVEMLEQQRSAQI